MVGDEDHGRFWIVGAIFCTIGFVLFYRYYLRFKL